MQLRPLGGNVIVEPVTRETLTASGIIIPDTAEDKEATLRGHVIAVGPGKFLENGNRQANDLQIGQEVIFKKDWNSKEIEFKQDGVLKKCLALSIDDVIAVIEK